MVARDLDTIPLIPVNRVVDDVMRAAVGVDEGNGITAVTIKKIIDNQSTWIATGDRDAAVARAAAIRKDPIELDVNVLILIVAAEQRYRLSSGAGKSQTADGDELRLL